MKKDFGLGDAIKIFLGIWALCFIVIFIYKICVPGSSQGDLFSLGQLFLEFTLIPIAVLGFWYAVQEFRKSQRRPHLFLAWDDDTIDGQEKSTTYVPGQTGEGEKKYSRISRSIALHNDGKNVAIWYSINLSFPTELFRRRDIPEGLNPELMRLSGFHRAAGGEHWEETRGPSIGEDIFRSNGTLASYPGQMLTLGRLEFYPILDENQDFQEYQIPYKIFTESGPSRIDHLRLIISTEE